MAKDITDLFSDVEKEALKGAIEDAELNTSGEIRVHIENNCKGEVLDRAAQIFKQLEMHKTTQRNGVLFYLAVENRRFAILGDVGINAVVPPNFWEEVKETMLLSFRENKFVDGLMEGIDMAGVKLKEFFPYQTDDVNELSDDISFSNN